MIYFSIRGDLENIELLLRDFEQIVSIEQDTRQRLKEDGAPYLGPQHMFKRIREESAESNAEYSELRAEYAKLIPRSNEICDREGIAYYIEGRGAPIEGNLPFQGSIFEFPLNRPSDMMDIDTKVRDTANQCIGALERRKGDELRQLINPIYWLRRAIVFVVRLPFTLLELSGFDVEIIQEHLIARLFQLVYVIALILILVRLGLTSLIDLSSLLP